MGLFNRCKHKWEEISFYTTKSKFENLIELKGRGEDLTYEMLNRKVIQTFQCKSCGKFKRFVEKI